jgi:hypothetical protein
VAVPNANTISTPLNALTTSTTVEGNRPGPAMDRISRTRDPADSNVERISARAATVRPAVNAPNTHTIPARMTINTLVIRRDAA